MENARLRYNDQMHQMQARHQEQLDEMKRDMIKKDNDAIHEKCNIEKAAREALYKQKQQSAEEIRAHENQSNAAVGAASARIDLLTTEMHQARQQTLNAEERTNMEARMVHDNHAVYNELQYAINECRTATSEWEAAKAAADMAYMAAETSKQESESVKGDNSRVLAEA